MKIEYVEVSQQEVTAYFAKDFKPANGKIFKHEVFFDANRGVFIFKVYLETESSDGPQKDDLQRS